MNGAINISIDNNIDFVSPQSNKFKCTKTHVFLSILERFDLLKLYEKVNILSLEFLVILEDYTFR